MSAVQNLLQLFIIQLDDGGQQLGHELGLCTQERQQASCPLLLQPLPNLNHMLEEVQEGIGVIMRPQGDVGESHSCLAGGTC